MKASLTHDRRSAGLAPGAAQTRPRSHPPMAAPVAGLVLLALAFGHTASVQIINGQCSGAIALTSGSTFTMNTANATSTGDPIDCL